MNSGHALALGIFGALFLLIVGSGWVYARRQRSGRELGFPGVPSPQVRRASRVGARMSGRDILRATEQLMGSNPGWDEIFAKLNPLGDAEIQQALIAIRGPHMFQPTTALQVIQTGCEDALRQNPAATARAAILAARRSAEKITHYGN